MTKPFRYSTITTAHKCMKYYELKELLGIPDGSDKSADLAFGTAIHTGIESLFGNMDVWAGITPFVEAWSDVAEGKELEYSRGDYEGYMALGIRLIEIFRDEYIKHFIPIALERKFEARLGKHGYSGTVDFIGEYKGVQSIVDWKTAAYPYDQYKLIVNEQTYGYAYLAEAALGYKAKQVVYGVAVKDMVNPRWQFKVAPITPEKMVAVLYNIEKMCDSVSETKVFVKNPGQCIIGRRVCPYFERCYGSKKETA